MRRIITDALGLGTPQGEHIDPQEAIDLLTDVWLASLVSWITGIEPPERLVEKLSGAARFLFGAGPDEA